MKSKVYIKDGVNLKDTIKEIFEEVGLDSLKNKRVFVKPNMLRVASPEECVITDPKLIEAVVDYLIENSVDFTVGDNPLPQKINEVEVAKRCGFFDASKGRFKNIGRYAKRVKIKHSVVKELFVSRDILDSEVLISLPKFKTHELTTLSIGIKNQFGIIPGGLKPKLHYMCPTLDDFCRLLIEIYNIRRPDLIIVDGLNIVDARGTLYQFNKLIAGNDAFAIDYTCALIAGIKPEINPLIKIALKEKLFDPDQLDIVETFIPLKGFAIPISIPTKDFFTGIGSRIFAQIQNLWVPAIEHNLCNRCYSCENVCPTRAIKRFNIDYKECIRCYCCFEVCPNNAIKRRIKII